MKDGSHTKPSPLEHFESLYPETSRQEEIGKIINFIKQGNSCQVVGLPGVGQSTILKLLIYNKSVRVKHLGAEQKSFHFVLVNFSEVRRRPLVDVVKFIFLSLVDSLRYRKLQEEYEATYAIFKESIILNDELVMFQGLKQAIDILTIEKGFSIVFLFDRFEEYIPVLNEDFFGNLRVLRNRAKYKFSVVFSLNRPLEDSIEPVMMREFYDFVAGNIVYLPIMDKPGVDFRVKHLEALHKKTIPQKTLAAIFSVTGGMGKLVKVSSEISLTQAEPIPTEEKELIAFLLSNKSILGSLHDIWQTLSPSEQDFLKNNEIYNESDPDYQYLSHVGLIEKDVFAIPLFKAFLKNQLVETAKKNAQSISFNANTNEIIQGEVTISDRLTSAEYRLLRFLIEHAGTVVERNQIIEAVWSDAITTEGVTDQALDQLLFRVRRKIEDDPNNPIHLQTVKGRGVRFSP